MKNILENLIQTIERNAIDNKATIHNVQLWAASWRNEMQTEQKLNIDGVVQAEASDSAVGATVGQRSVGTNAEARVNCAEGKHFWSMNKGIQECLFCPARREAPSGGHL